MRIYDSYRAAEISFSKEEIQNLQDLHLYIEEHIDLPIKSQIIISESGLQLDEKTFESESNTMKWFLFDRRIIENEVQAEPLEIQVTEVESLLSIKSSPSFSIQITESMFFKYIELLSETAKEHYLKAQNLFSQLEIFSMALKAATLNLHEFIRKLIKSFSSFEKIAEKYLSSQDQFTHQYQSNLSLLSSISFCPKLLQDSKQNTIKKLADVFDIKELEILHAKALGESTVLSKNVTLLKENISVIQQALSNESVDNIRLSLEDKNLQLKEAEKLIKRLELLLMNIQIEVDKEIIKDRILNKNLLSKLQPVKELLDIELQLKNMLLEFIKTRELFAQHFYTELKMISCHQTTISQLNALISQSNEIVVNSAQNFQIYQYFHSFSTYYFALVMEIIRRKKFINFINSKLSDFNQALSALYGKENTRRERFANDILAHIPDFIIQGKIFKGLDSLRSMLSLPSIPIPEIKEEINDLDMTDLLDAVKEIGYLVLKFKGSSEAIFDSENSDTRLNYNKLIKLQNTIKKVMNYLNEMPNELNQIISNSIVDNRLKLSDHQSIKTPSMLATFNAQQQTPGLLGKVKRSYSHQTNGTTVDKEPSSNVTQKMKIYEERIKSLEMLLQQSYAKLKEQRSSTEVLGKESPEIKVSDETKAADIVEDLKKRLLEAENKNVSLEKSFKELQLAFNQTSKQASEAAIIEKTLQGSTVNEGHKITGNNEPSFCSEKGNLGSMNTQPAEISLLSAIESSLDKGLTRDQEDMNATKLITSLPNEKMFDMSILKDLDREEQPSVTHDFFEIKGILDKIIHNVDKKRINHQLACIEDKEMVSLLEQILQLLQGSRVKISYNNFHEGDTVLFLPTKNPSKWSIFNIQAPYYYLCKENFNEFELSKKRCNWLIAEIVKLEKKVSVDASPNRDSVPKGFEYHDVRVHLKHIG